MNQSSNQSLQYLIEKTIEIRKDVVEISISIGGHAAASLSCIEIMVLLYYSGVMNISPNNINKDNRDRFIHSKGHAENVLYSILSDRGFFPREWINKYYRKGDCRLGGHPDKNIPGVEVTTGALGHGLGMAIGTALAAKMDSKKHLHFVLMGDAVNARQFRNKRELVRGSVRDTTRDSRCRFGIAGKSSFGWS